MKTNDAWLSVSCYPLVLVVLRAGVSAVLSMQAAWTAHEQQTLAFALSRLQVMHLDLFSCTKVAYWLPE